MILIASAKASIKLESIVLNFMNKPGSARNQKVDYTGRSLAFGFFIRGEAAGSGPPNPQHLTDLQPRSFKNSLLCAAASPRGAKIAACIGRALSLTASMLTPRFIRELMQSLIDGVMQAARSAIRLLP